MPAGDPGKEQFRRIITEFRNLHILAALGPVFDFRSEVVANDEFGVRGGLDETTKDHYVEHLLACDRMRRRVTYNPEKAPLGDLIERAINSDETLLGSTAPFGGDEIQEAPGGLVALPWSVDGMDPNIPLGSQLNFRSQNALVLLGAIDRAIVNWTRLESRFRTSFLYVKDSMRMYGSPGVPQGVRGRRQPSRHGLGRAADGRAAGAGGFAELAFGNRQGRQRREVMEARSFSPRSVTGG